MRIVFCGGGDFGVNSLRWLAGSEHEVALVVTQPARPAGRGRKVVRTAIAQEAEALKLPCLETADINAPEHTARIRQLEPQVILIIALGQKIGPELLHVPRCRTINLHSSLLPKYRGAAPINWAIINGETETGLTVIELNEQWDAGEILGQARTPIGVEETAGELHDRLAAMGPGLLAEVLNNIARGTVTPLPQNHALASRAPKLKKTDGAIDWSREATVLRNQIHGMWPWPGAQCLLLQSGKNTPETVLLARARTPDSPEEEPIKAWVMPGPAPQPGELLDDLTIQCGRGRLQLLGVKPAGGRLMSFTDFVNGRRLKPRDRFLNG
ncbi:MAG: methionyl-tRNA formyltransferase [Sedimentisphaerales bacterium]|nr:methionyl-tRNA formyltransferase [Sedimentisphaerales bacterium]